MKFRSLLDSTWRRALRASFAGTVVVAATAHTAVAQVEVPLPTGLDAKIETLLSPLSGMPAMQRADEPLFVELEAGAASDLQGLQAALIPSFGQVLARNSLGTPIAVAPGVASRLWPGRLVDRLTYALTAGLQPGLYDLEAAAAGVGLLSGGSGVDMQRRAVAIVAEYPAAPRVVVLSDTHTGDPRAVEDPAQNLVYNGDYLSTTEFLERSVGNPANSERWAAFARAIREVNLVRPDFVLITGDLTFANHATVLPYEYEDAWRLIDRLEVPAFVAPGNHDLYAYDDYLSDTDLGLDGTQLWKLFFGPTYYSVDIGQNLHLTAINTFDWPALYPFPPPDFPTLAGGQVLQEQYDWLHDDWRAFRTRAPQGMLVSFAHHDPSWQQRSHPWSGERRLETRDLMADSRVGVHFSGHTHENRVARYHRGDVVETNGRPPRQPVRQLHYVKRDDTLDESYTQEQLGAILHDPAHGPLFVTTTTCSSQIIGDGAWGLGDYWGWRLSNLIDHDGQGGVDPIDFGYPATDEFLAERAERPENWTAAHSEFGLFAYPSFELDQEELDANDGSAPTATQRLTSRLITDLQVTPRFSVAASPGQRLAADNGTVTQVHYGDGKADVWVQATVPAEGRIEVKVRPATATDDPPAQPPPTPGPQADPGRFGGALSPWALLALLASGGIAARRRKTC